MVGVVPPLKPAAKLTESKKIAVFATESTVRSSYLDNLIKNFCKGVSVTKVSANLLVNMAETKFYENTFDFQALCDFLLSSELSGYEDLIALGCTHFHFLKKELIEAWRKVFGTSVQILDCSQAVFQQSLRLIGELPSGKCTFSAKLKMYSYQNSVKRERLKVLLR